MSIIVNVDERGPRPLARILESTLNDTHPHKVFDGPECPLPLLFLKDQGLLMSIFK